MKAGVTIIPITQDEAKYLRETFPNVYITATSKKKKSRKKYYLAEIPKHVQALERYRAKSVQH